MKYRKEHMLMYLELNEIRKSFGEKENRTEVLHGINAGIDKGEICVLLGPSGCGKSTLLNIIGGIETVDSGEVIIGGDRVGTMNEKELSLYRRKHLGYVFQTYNLIPNLTVKENVEVGAYLSDTPLDVDELLNMLGLWEHRNKIPNQISGGQQQRTSIGRAIVKNPDILLCDEPTGALDYRTSKEILQIIEEVNAKIGNTVLIVTHNDGMQQMADRILRMKDGLIIHDEKNTGKISAMDLEW
jgi:putative ABC transport system ATP-binding protein